MVKESGQQPGTGSAGNGRGARDTMTDTAYAAAEQVQSAATDQIEQQKRAASQSIQAFAQAVRRASDELSKQDQTAAAQLIQQAAGGLESLSETLSNRSVGDMVSMARDFGRRNPMALAGGAALLGMALGRVARTATADNGSHAASDLSSKVSSGAVTDASAAGEFPASRASTPRATSPFPSPSTSPSTPPTPSRPQSTSTSPSTAPSTPKATTPPRPGNQYGGKTSGGSND